jgi:predicted amidohydrolase YtcJ
MASAVPRSTVLVALVLIGLAAACGGTEQADLVLVNGRVYSLDWVEPSPEGVPSPAAPFGPDGWSPGDRAVAVRNGRVVRVGTELQIDRFIGPDTDVRDLGGATVLPGLIDSHVHLAELGASLERVDLVGVATEAEAVERVAAAAREVPAGEWIVGWGWDEGAWANRYPDMTLLSDRVPDHPVVLRGLHSFAVWGNRLAFERAGIGPDTPDPAAGQILKSPGGRPTGVLTNTAGALLMDAVPPPTPEQLEARLGHALEALAAAGYVSVHEAGADHAMLDALTAMDADGRLPIRVVVLLAARDTALIDEWVERGPRPAGDGRLSIIGVKAFYDGAMGSRGAYFLEDYSDRPSHRGVGGAEYGFDADRLAAMMRAGFQVSIHAIGDRANRESLDFFERVMAEAPDTRFSRPRIEHAQVVSPDDVMRFGRLGVTASMQPAHAVEDMPWAEDRIGPVRVAGAYAWRTLRRAGARLAFNSDLPATDYDIFYGLHSAVTRQTRAGEPPGGWRPEEAMTIEEAVRGWTKWAAALELGDLQAGTLDEGGPADVTVVDIDVFQVGATTPAALLGGRVLLTVAGGRVVFDAEGPTANRDR